MSVDEDDPSPNRFLCLKGVEVSFKSRTPKYPVKIKVVPGGGHGMPKSKEFVSGSGEMLKWDTDIHLSPTSNFEIIVKGSHAIKWRRKRSFASVRVDAVDLGEMESATKEDGLNTDFFKDDGGMISVKLTLAPPVVSSTALRKTVEDAAALLDKRPILLEKLGKARSFIEVVKNFGDVVGDIHPAAKAAVGAFNMLYERLENQEKLHESASKLLDELISFLPFTEIIDTNIMANEAAKGAVKDFLALLQETCEFVVGYSSSSVLGELISSQQPKVDQLETDFKRVKTRYDWSIKTDVWKINLKLEKFGDMRLLQVLQVSTFGPAGKEFYRTNKSCLPGTRVAILERIAQWAETSSDKKLFWLQGATGTGKSAIANSVAHAFDSQRLLAGCFFFSRSDPELCDISKVVPALAAQLAAWHEPFCARLLRTLQGEERNKLASKTLMEQFELLIRSPVGAMSEDERDAMQAPQPLVVVIDGLDECGATRSERLQLARIIVQISKLVPWLKVFVTSTPLSEFVHAFEGTSSADTLLEKVDLGEAPDTTKDIEMYARYRANLVAQEQGDFESGWLTDEQIKALTRLSKDEFRWISDKFDFFEAQADVDHAVEEVLNDSEGRVSEEEGEGEDVAVTELPSLPNEGPGQADVEHTEDVEVVVGDSEGRQTEEEEEEEEDVPLRVFPSVPTDGPVRTEEESESQADVDHSVDPEVALDDSEGRESEEEEGDDVPLKVFPSVPTHEPGGTKEEEEEDEEEEEEDIPLKVLPSVPQEEPHEPHAINPTEMAPVLKA